MATVPQIDTATLTQWLADARNALHQLEIGRLSVEVASDGARIIYTRSNVNQLRAYIARLESQIAGGVQSGAINVMF